MATSEQITAYKAVAQAIKSATADGENTADKVGGVLVNIINALISDETLAQYAKQIVIGSQEASQANDGTVWGALNGLALSLEDYALKTDIPNVSGFATTSTTDELAENIDSVSQDVETLQDEVARMETPPTKVNEIITGVTGSRFVSGSGVAIGDVAMKSELPDVSKYRNVYEVDLGTLNGNTFTLDADDAITALDAGRRQNGGKGIAMLKYTKSGNTYRAPLLTLDEDDAEYPMLYFYDRLGVYTIQLDCTVAADVYWDEQIFTRVI